MYFFLFGSLFYLKILIVNMLIFWLVIRKSQNGFVKRDIKDCVIITSEAINFSGDKYLKNVFLTIFLQHLC